MNHGSMPGAQQVQDAISEAREASMPKTDLAQITFRVRDPDELARLDSIADRLIPVLEGDDPERRRWTRSRVYRQAMLDGLRGLEKKHADAIAKHANPKPSSKKK